MSKYYMLEDHSSPYIVYFTVETKGIDDKREVVDILEGNVIDRLKHLSKPEMHNLLFEVVVKNKSQQLGNINTDEIIKISQQFGLNKDNICLMTYTSIYPIGSKH